MAKVRVYELAKDLGLESKELLAKLQEVGEFVRSASSTVEAPVVRKLMEKFPDLKAVAAEAPKPVKKAAAKKAAAKPAAPTQEEIEAALASLPEDTRSQIAAAQAAVPVAPVAPAATFTPAELRPPCEGNSTAPRPRGENGLSQAWKTELFNENSLAVILEFIDRIADIAKGAVVAGLLGGVEIDPRIPPAS